MNIKTIRPILKWAGGKSKLLPIYRHYYPKELGKTIRRYAEPFVGGGAVFLDLYSAGLIDEALLMDSNDDLVDLYNVVKKDVYLLIDRLRSLRAEYLGLTEKYREEFFYLMRDSFNREVNSFDFCQITKSAFFIFLNKICFNGLYRVNSKGLFNVPFGRYKNPQIFSEDQLLSLSQALGVAEIVKGDFSQSEEWILTSPTFVYFDPPYRPLSVTSSFTSYCKGGFDDSEQKKLADFFVKLAMHGSKVMLSNSDPFSLNGDCFFEDLFSAFRIIRVDARRAINSDPRKRGIIKEILVTTCD